MARKLSDLPTVDLLASLIATEQSAGVQSDGAKALQLELDHRAATDKSVGDKLARARRFAALIADGHTMKEFRSADFTPSDRQLALALGAKRSWPSFAPAAFNAFAKKPAADR